MTFKCYPFKNLPTIYCSDYLPEATAIFVHETVRIMKLYFRDNSEHFKNNIIKFLTSFHQLSNVLEA